MIGVQTRVALIVLELVYGIIKVQISGGYNAQDRLLLFTPEMWTLDVIWVYAGLIKAHKQLNFNV